MAHSRLRTRALSKGRLPALWLAAGLAGCLGSYDRAVDETRAGLIGKSESELRQCLGVPTEFDQEGGEEFLTFRWTVKPDGRPRLSPGGGVVVGIDPRGPRDAQGFPIDPERGPFCQLDFVLGKEGVTKVVATGRDDVGMRIDGQCMMRARRCLDRNYDDADPE
ncbi:MAG TPA: hypothetical protein VMR86_11405 [Myxococcota bacterium]|nr:hypothetical protein [Myxococcota bacterium]